VRKNEAEWQKGARHESKPFFCSSLLDFGCELFSGSSASSGTKGKSPVRTGGTTLGDLEITQSSGGVKALGTSTAISATSTAKFAGASGVGGPSGAGDQQNGSGSTQSSNGACNAIVDGRWPGGYGSLGECQICESRIGKSCGPGSCTWQRTHSSVKGRPPNGCNCLDTARKECSGSTK
jgi:hypothetical protein